jgi:large subunit ribosomal protein L15
MSELSQLRPQEGSVKKKKRVGRGESSGLGKTAGVGHKGQKARQGMGKPKRGFEGGQMPLARRLPKRGFVSRNRVEYAIINVGQLAGIDAGTTVTIDYLRERGMIKKGLKLLKILGDGDLNVALTVFADKFSAKASELIQKSGGQAKHPAEQA